MKEMLEQRETHHNENATSGRSDRRWDRIVNVGVGLGGGGVGSLRVTQGRQQAGRQFWMRIGCGTLQRSAACNPDDRKHSEH